MDTLIKFLQKVCSPLGISLILFGYLLLSRGSFRRFTASLGLLTLLIPSLPVVSDYLVQRLEDVTPAVEIEAVPTAPIIVVLGGTAAPEWGPTKAEELAGSRLLEAFRLFRAQKAPQIMVTSGIAYHTASGDLRTEADDMRDILIEYGVPASAIVVENQAQTTQQNAFYSAQILRAAGINEIILVTSAYHMQRANLWFLLEGLKVHPVGAGYIVRGGDWSVQHYMPSANALNRSSAAIKEYLGLIPIAWKTRLQ